MSLNIKITSNAKEAVKKLEAFPQKLKLAIVAEMNKQNQLAIGEITRNRLTGKGPFPVSEHRLGVVTARLRKSINASNAQITGDTVQSRIGTNVEYAGVHEFGFSGSIFVNSHTRRSHLRRIGRRATRTRIAEAIVTGHGRNVDIPARAAIKTGLDDYEPTYGQGISDAITAAWDKHVAEGRT